MLCERGVYLRSIRPIGHGLNHITTDFAAATEPAQTGNNKLRHSLLHEHPHLCHQPCYGGYSAAYHLMDWSGSTADDSSHQLVATRPRQCLFPHRTAAFRINCVTACVRNAGPGPRQDGHIPGTISTAVAVAPKEDAAMAWRQLSVLHHHRQRSHLFSPSTAGSTERHPSAIIMPSRGHGNMMVRLPNVCRWSAEG
jgi:hypothetical protein